MLISVAMPVGTAKASIVSGLVIAPQPTAAASTNSQYARPVVQWRYSANQETRKRKLVRISDEYPGLKRSATLETFMRMTVAIATGVDMSSRLNTKASAAEAPTSSAGMSPGRPNQMPGTRRSENPGGYFAA